MRTLTHALGGAAAVAAVVLAGPAALLPPASAVSTTLSYDCTFPDVPSLGTQVFTVVLDTDLPDIIPAGQAIAWTVTGKVIVTPDVVAYLRSTTATSVGGSASVDTTVNGNHWGASLTIPQTSLPASGPMELSGTGSGGTLPAAPSGRCTR